MKPQFNIYILSDNHFNHWNINRYCKRKYPNLNTMNRDMIKKWNSIVKKNDMVIHLGDIIFTKGASEEIDKIIKQLNGRLILIRGNHDRKSYSWYLSHGFDFIADKVYWEYNKKKIMFIHDPNRIEHRDLRKCDFIIHGHRHNKGLFVSRRKHCRIVNVSVEQLNYNPMNLTTLLNRLGQGYYDKKNKKK